VRGVSALQAVLEELGDAPVEVLAVWEPVLATDIAPPTTTVLGILHGRRVRQYWDPQKLLSEQLIKALRANPKLLKPDMGEEIPDVAWDVVMIYDAQDVWTGDIPFPRWYGAPVLDATEEAKAELRSRIEGLKGTSPP
jgi:hypothetical protein